MPGSLKSAFRTSRKLMASYDQSNLPALASAQPLNCGRPLFEIAQHGRPETPSDEGSEEILGMREAADGNVVDPSLTQHAARRQAAKAEIMMQNRLAAEEKKHWRLRTEDTQKGGETGKSNKGEAKRARVRASPGGHLVWTERVPMSRLRTVLAPKELRPSRMRTNRV